MPAPSREMAGRVTASSLFCSRVSVAGPKELARSQCVDRRQPACRQSVLWVRAKSSTRVFPHQTLPRYTPGSTSRISSRIFFAKNDVFE